MSTLVFDVDDPRVVGKKCKVCGEFKAFSAFSVERAKPGGLCPRCRACMGKSVRKYQAKVRETYLASRRAKGRANRQRWQATRLLYEARNKLAIRATARRREKRDRPRLRMKQRERSRRPDYRATQRRWFEQHPESVRAIQKRANAKRRALESGAVVAERLDFKAIAKRDKMRCHICRRKIKVSDLHFGHVIPLAKGGTHAAINIAVSHAACNLAKGARVLTLF